MHRFTLFVLLTGLLALAAPARADDPAAWTAWLHYGRHMTLIDSNGDVLREVDLPLPEGYSLYPNIAVSRHGGLVAYEVRDGKRAVQLIVYDTKIENPILNFALPDDISFTSMDEASELIYNETDSVLAYAFGTNDGQWKIVIFSLTGGETAYTLESNNIAATNMESLVGVPSIRQYKGVEVTFTLESSYIWNTVTREIRPDIAYASGFTNTFLPTNEVIMSLNDLRFSTRIHGTIFNTLQVYDPLTDSRYPFYVDDSSAGFIQNGERIMLVSVTQGITPIDRWTIIERDGMIVGDWTLPSNIYVTALRGIPDGFIYSVRIMTNGNSSLNLPALFAVNTRDGLDIGHKVWSINVKEFQSYFAFPELASLRIAWVHSDAPVGPFKPWAQLAEPVYAPTPQPSAVTITPTLIPTPPPLFHVGQTVRVQTINGEILNLRAAPTRKSDIIVYIEDEARLELLEGPVDAEGFQWWRVRLPDGLEGWVVENDGDLQTLMPE